MKRRALLAGALSCLTLLGCDVSASGEPPLMDELGTADGQEESFLTSGIRESTPESLGVLRVANGSDLQTLQLGVGLPVNAAQNIVAYRAGDDELSGTADDERYETLAELDLIPYVGPVAFQKLLTYAKANGLVLPPPSSCSRESAFAARWSQAWNPRDVEWVLQSGERVRGLEALDHAAAKSNKLRVLGFTSPVVEYRLLATHVYQVLASRSGREYLDALTHAAWAEANGWSWAQDEVRDVLLWHFAQAPTTDSQQRAFLKLLLRQAEGLVPAAALADYRLAARSLELQVQSGSRTLLNSNPASLDARLTSGTRSFSFQYSNSWGIAPSLGVWTAGMSSMAWTDVPAAPRCEGWRTTAFGGRTFLHHDGPATYAQGEALCGGRGGRLVTLGSAEENAFVRTLNESAVDTWVGLSDRAQEGRFVWASNAPVHYINWAPGQPDDARGDEDCVALWDNAGRPVWNDVSCDLARTVTCELP
jgi:hypothetical protein